MSMVMPGCHGSQFEWCDGRGAFALWRMLQRTGQLNVVDAKRNRGRVADRNVDQRPRASANCCIIRSSSSGVSIPPVAAAQSSS